MSFALPMALLLCLPLGGLFLLSRQSRSLNITRLPGAWHGMIAPALRHHTSLRSNLSQTAVPILCFALALLVVVALSRPGFDLKDDDTFTTLAGRVVVLDVGSDMTRHRYVLDELYRIDPGVSTALVAVSGDAYRVVPFTNDQTQIDRYVRVLSAELMPRPGQKAHLGLALAEQMLADGGFAVRQIVVLSARSAPETLVEVPLSESKRIVIPLATEGNWSEWATAQHGTVLQAQALPDIGDALHADARAVARSELPAARFELSTALIAIAAIFWLLLFRRRTS